MEILKTELPGLLILKPSVFSDDRGYFFESYREDKYEFINHRFLQHNISCSKKNVVRGLHYQASPHAQGKLCQVLKGNALDVTLDIRAGSPTFGKYYSIELSEENKIQLWIPPGFAHGFSALTDNVVFNYKCTKYYHKDSERSIIYNDPDLKIDWKVESAIVSEKDLQGALFKNIEEDFFYEG